MATKTELAAREAQPALPTGAAHEPRADDNQATFAKLLSVSAGLIPPDTDAEALKAMKMSIEQTQDHIIKSRNALEETQAVLAKLQQSRKPLD